MLSIYYDPFIAKRGNYLFQEKGKRRRRRRRTRSARTVRSLEHVFCFACSLQGKYLYLFRCIRQKGLFTLKDLNDVNALFQLNARVRISASLTQKEARCVFFTLLEHSISLILKKRLSFFLNLPRRSSVSIPYVVMAISPQLVDFVSEQFPAAVAACLGIGYLFGCFMSTFFVCKLFRGADPRHHASRNVGATNCKLITGSTKLTLLVLICDISKGAIPLVVYGSLTGRYTEELSTEKKQVYLNVCWVVIGFAVMLGHVYPFWLRFQG